MLVGGKQKVYVYREPVDFRKGHHGLRALVSQAGLNLWEGDMVVFFSRCRRKAKVLHTDETGIWLHYKQLSRGNFAQQAHTSVPGEVLSIQRDELDLLLSGSRYRIEQPAKAWKPLPSKT